MACILEIRKTIQKSIDEKLFLSKDVGIVKRGAEKIRDYLNDLWDSPIAVVKRHKFNGNVYVVEIKSLDAAVNKEFKKQLAAEKKHKQNLDFFNDEEKVIEETDSEKSEKLRKEQENRDLAQYQNLTKESDENFIASEKTIRDLAARLSDRIGIPFIFESDRTKEYKGKLEGNKAVINLAYATLDTPIHEILGHPIIRAIKNNNVPKFTEQDIFSGLNIIFKSEEDVYKTETIATEEGFPNPTVTKNGEEVSLEEFNNAYIKSNNAPNQLYQNLLKELEIGKGKEVLDRIKRDYKEKQTSAPVSDTNNYGYRLSDFINVLIDKGYSAEKIVEQVNTLYPSVDGEYMYFNFPEYVPEYQGDEGPSPVTDAEIVYRKLGIGFTKSEYNLEEQQEEAIVELLGMMTAEKLDAVKDGKLISLLKRLLKEMKVFMKQLLGQKEVEIDKLPDNMTLGDIADLLAYSNSKLILPGNEVIYTTPDNQTFKTYQEASNHISQLAKDVKDVDLNSIKINTETSEEQKRQIKQFTDELKDLKNQFNNFKFEKIPFSNKIDIYTEKGRLRQNYWARKEDGTTGYLGGSKETLTGDDYDGFVLDKRGDPNAVQNREYVKISDDEAKKVFDEVNDKNTATRASIDIYNALARSIDVLENRLNALEEGSPLENFITKNKEYEQSKEIIEEWKKVNNIQYNPEEIYSRGQEFSSVVGAYSNFDVNLMMQNLLQHIEDNEKAGGKFAISSYTKPIDKQISHLEGGGGKIKFKIYPKSNDILWASNTDVYSGSVWDASKKVNKDKKSELLGVSYTKYPSLNNVNNIQPNLSSVIDNLEHHHNELGIVLTGNNFRLEYDEDIPSSTKKIINSLNSILDQKYGNLVKPEIKPFNRKEFYNVIPGFEDNSFKEKFKNVIQPTQTKDNVSSIESVKNKVVTNNYYGLTKVGNNKWAIQTEDGDYENVFESKEEAEIALKKLQPTIKEKEYTSQALINTKIAKLKEVAKKYPRSLIRSEVVRTREYYPGEFSGFAEDELPFQKLSSTSVIKPTPKVDKSNQTELFQIEQQESRLKEKSLVDRVNVLLGDYIKANNIKVEFLDKVLSKNGKEVVAKYDSIKRIIQINSNQASALTLPEELAHDLTLALGIDHVLVKRALNLIGRLDYKNILGQQYVDAYKGNVNLLKMDLLGKLISKQIADPRLPDELKSEDGVKIWETIKNAIKAFISLFKPNSNITSELDNIVSELSDMIISGKEVGNPTMSVEMYDINSTIHDVKKGFPMTNSNNQKLLSREKTFTLRTKNYPSGLYKFGKNYYNVLNMYGKAVKADEIKNPDYLKKKFVGDEDIRFDHVKAFFDGTEPLYVYQITKVDDSIQAMLEEQAKSGGIPQDVEKYYVFYTRLISKLKKDVKKINNSLSDESKRIEAKIQEIEATLQNLIYNNNKQNLIDLAHKTIDDVDTYLKKLYALEQSGQNFNVKNIEKSIKVLHTFENLEEVGERARLLISSLKRFGIKLLDEEHLRLTGREITDKEKNEIQQDINYGELQFGTLSDVRNYLGKTIGLSIKEKQSIIEKNNKESKKILDIEIKKLEEFQKTQGITGKDIYKIFIQEHRGSTVLTKPYTSDYYKLIADSFEKENGAEIRKKLSVYNSKSNNWEPKDSAYYSDNYKEIHKKGNEPLLEFYNFFKKTIADITDKLPVDELDENFIPNIVEATLLSVLKSDKDSVGKLKDGINHIMSANFWGTRENEYFINRELEKNEVPLKYIGNIPSDKKSNDLGYVLLNFMHFGNSYEQMSDVLPKVELFQELMQEKQFIVSKKRNAGSSTNLNSLIDGFIKMQVKGEMKSDNDYFGDKAPIIDFALTYTSLLRIGFSPFAAAANFAVGGTGNMIEAMGGRYFNLANLTEANSIFLAQSFNENSKLSNIISKVNPLMEIDDFLSLEDIQKGANSYTQKLKSGAYFLQRIGEKKLQVSVMIAIMLNNKVTTKNGDQISMWEAFDENGVWDEKLMGYEFLEIDLNKLTNKVQAVNQGIHGRYSSKDAAIFAQQSLFRAVYQFKKWIPAAIESRFGGKKINERLGLETEGRYKSYLKGFKYLWANVKGDIKSIEENKFTELDIYSMRKNLAELLIVTVLLLAKAGFEDDKLRKKPAYKFTMSLLNQVSGDLLFFYDPINMQKSFTRLPIERTLKDFSNIFINIPAIFDDGSKSDKKKYHYRSGPNKGENKFTGSFINATPGVKQAFDIYRLGNESPAKK